MDHDIRKIEFLMLAFVEVLRNHRNALTITSQAVTALRWTAVQITIFIQRTHSFLLPNASVSEGSGAIVFIAKPKRLEEEHSWNLNDSQKQQDNLHPALSRIELLFNLAGIKEHEDQHVKETRRGFPTRVPIDRPFINDGDDEISKDRLEENHSRDKIAKNVNLGLEVSRIDILQAERVCHLESSC